MEVGKVKPGIHRGAYRTLPYYGGKRGGGKGEWIAGLLPSEKNSCYIEPFAGMAGVLLSRQPVKVEILNDLNGRLVNWWRAVRDWPEEFSWLVEHTPISRDKYTWAARAVDDPELPAIRRSLAFHILLDQSPVASDCRLSPGGWSRRFTPAVGSIARHSKEDIKRLSARLWTVQLDNCDALGLLERTADCDYAVIYCDPPYPTADTSAYAFGNLDFHRLADLLRLQKGAVAVSGYPGEWDCLGWAAEQKQAIRRQISGGGEPRTEVLWRNARCVELATVRHLL